MRWNILVVDDDAALCESLAAWLREDGHSVDTAGSGRQALAKARSGNYAVCFIDLKMPGGFDGIETMREIRMLQPGAAVVIITAHAAIDTAVAAIKQGAQEYVVKPCDPREISLMVSRILKAKRLERGCDLVAENPRMREIVDLSRRIINLPSPVLLRGESGTGKGLLARAIHNAGTRAARPFTSINCPALAGSFSKFEMAGGGTIFLEDVGEVAPKLQSDLLRVLEGRDIALDARVIAATGTDLAEAVREGRFRADLYGRLSVIEIAIPPLRERREDIPVLARCFIRRLSPELGKAVSGISADALDLLLRYDWPGNIRELENAIERAIVTCGSGDQGEKDFAFLGGGETKPAKVPAGLTLAEMERCAIAAALKRSGGNIKETAAALGIDRSTLYDKIRKYGIPRGA
jgi:DNA-binding NtrC family response regulator